VFDPKHKTVRPQKQIVADPRNALFGYNLCSASISDTMMQLQIRLLFAKMHSSTNKNLTEVIIMKTSSKALFILSITWIIVSLLWFLWVKNTTIGIIWLCLGIVELIIAIIRKKKEQN